jgi:hypothetical protein
VWGFGLQAGFLSPAGLAIHPLIGQHVLADDTHVLAASSESLFLWDLQEVRPALRRGARSVTGVQKTRQYWHCLTFCPWPRHVLRPAKNSSAVNMKAARTCRYAALCGNCCCGHRPCHAPAVSGRWAAGEPGRRPWDVRQHCATWWVKVDAGWVKVDAGGLAAA